MKVKVLQNKTFKKNQISIDLKGKRVYKKSESTHFLKPVAQYRQESMSETDRTIDVFWQ